MVPSPKHLRETLHAGIAGAFEAWGRLVARHALKVFPLSLVVLVLLAAGVQRLPGLFELRARYLWAPTQQPAYKAWTFIKDNFGEDGNVMVLYAKRADGGNIFEKDALKELLKAHEWTTEEAEAPAADGSGRMVDWDDVCHKHPDHDDCASDETSFLALWDFDEDKLDEDSDDTILDKISALHQSQTAEAFSGGLKTEGNGADEKVKSAKGVFLAYALNDVEGDSFNFEAVWNAGIRDQVDASVIEVANRTPRSYDDETNRLVQGDLPIFFIGLIVILIYLTFTIGPVTSATRSRVLLGLMSLGNMLLAVAAGFGIAAYAGVSFPPIAPLLPLIILGVQVDGVIILVDTLNLEDPADSIEDRMGRSLREAGPTILITTITTVVAFLVGSVVDLPAVTMFCLYAACSFTASTLSTFSFFLCLLAIDERRLQAGRVSFLPCIKADMCPACPTGRRGASDEQGPAASSDKVEAELLGPIQRFVRDKYAPTLLRPAVSAGVVLAFVLLVVLSLAATPTLQLGLPDTDILPDDSYMMRTLALEAETFGGQRIFADLVVRTPGPDFTEEKTHERIHRGMDRIEDEDYYVAFFPRWDRAYEQWLLARGKSVSDDEYTRDLEDFLDEKDFSSFRERVKCGGKDCEEPTAVRYQLQYKKPTSGVAIDGLNRRNEMEAHVRREEGLSESFVYAFDFLLAETDVIIWDFVISNMAFACTSIFVLMLLFTPPIVALWITVCVASIFVDLLGMMWAVGVALNAVAFVNLVMSVGLSVDYCVHIAHTYDSIYESSRGADAAGPLPDARQVVQETLTRMGTSVLKGGWTTILGIFVIAFSSSVAFRTFFTMLVFTVIFGILHGLVLLPVLLAYASRWPQRKSIGAVAAGPATGNKAADFTVVSSARAAAEIEHTAPAVSSAPAAAEIEHTAPAARAQVPTPSQAPIVVQVDDAAV